MVSAGHWEAAGYDGTTTEPIVMHVGVRRGSLEVQPAPIEADRKLHRLPPRRWPFDEIDISQRFDTAPRVIDWPGVGWSLQLNDRDGRFDPTLRAAGWRPGLAARWQASRWGVALAGIALVLLAVWLERDGLGRAAQAALPMVPVRVDRHFDRVAREWLHANWWEATTLPAERRDPLRARYTAMVDSVDPDGEHELRFAARRGDPGFVNALALPGGTVYVFDGLVRCLDDDEVMAVLAHELAHVRQRHAVRGLLRDAGGVALASVVFGDWSSVVGGAAAGIGSLAYSRDAEREADAMALKTLTAIGTPRAALARAFAKLGHCVPGASEPPAIFSTHPPTDERIEAAGGLPS